MSKFTNFLTGEKVTPQDWQTQLAAGDHYLIETEIAGQLVTVYGHIQKRYGRAKLGIWQVTAYSQFCPDGESGILHICDSTAAITQTEFDLAQGWPAHFADTDQADNAPGPSRFPPDQYLDFDQLTPDQQDQVFRMFYTTDFKATDRRNYLYKVAATGTLISRTHKMLVS